MLPIKCVRKKSMWNNNVVNDNLSHNAVIAKNKILWVHIVFAGAGEKFLSTIFPVVHDCPFYSRNWYSVRVKRLVSISYEAKLFGHVAKLHFVLRINEISLFSSSLSLSLSANPDCSRWSGAQFSDAEYNSTVNYLQSFRLVQRTIREIYCAYIWLEILFYPVDRFLS